MLSPDPRTFKIAAVVASDILRKQADHHHPGVPDPYLAERCTALAERIACATTRRQLTFLVSDSPYTGHATVTINDAFCCCVDKFESLLRDLKVSFQRREQIICPRKHWWQVWQPHEETVTFYTIERKSNPAIGGVTSV